CLTPASARAQSFLGKNVAHWQAELTKKEPAVRRNAAFALGKLGPDAQEAVAALLMCLATDTDKGVKETAAYSLGQICKRGRAPEEVLAQLARILANQNEDPQVRRSAAVALGHCATDIAGVRSALEAVLLERKDNKDEDRKLEGLRQNAV